MTDPDRWDHLSELVETASGLPPAERETFLRARTNDADLRQEVLSLLATSVHPDLFNKPAFEWFGPALDIESFTPQAVVPRLLVGERLAGRFLLLSFLGRGGMAEVYEAQDDKLGGRVAMKLLDPNLAAQPGFLDRFKREILLARKVSHPNLARVYDLVEVEDHPLGHLYFYVMELIEGETLGARLKRAGPLAASEALVVASQLAAGLNAAHAAGVIHRDFKPGNILLAEGRAVITDFGLAAPIPSGVGEVQLKTTSLLLGTPGYVAPEQWAGQAASAATDIYSFGIVLHEMVTGRHPNSKAGGPIASPEWAAVIAKCLALDPKARWRTSVEAVDGLEPGILSRRNIVYGLVGICTGGMALSVNRMRYSMWNQPLPKVTNLLLTPVQNITGDPKFDDATELLRAQLDQSPHLQLLTSEKQQSTLQLMGQPSDKKLDPATAREIAWRQNTPAVLYAAISPLGPDFVLNLKLEILNGRPDSIGPTAENSFRAGGPQDLIHQIRVAGWRSATGHSFKRSRKVSDQVDSCRAAVLNKVFQNKRRASAL